jgi:hypothetical protein
MLILTLRLLAVLVLLFLVPLVTHAAWWMTRSDLATSWRGADWSSARLLPEPAAAPRAMVHLYAARVGRWRGIFAHHTWIVVKEAGADRYTRYDKVGWGSPVRMNGWAADGRWFGNEPQLILAVEGEAAERLIPRVRAAVTSYRYRSFGDYRPWPGPNSNTFVAHVMKEVPELGAALPPTALGKDWHPHGEWLGLTPSRTGIRVSFGGFAGLAVGWIEGVELNLLGLVAGLDIRRPAVKLPGWGRIGLSAA